MSEFREDLDREAHRITGAPDGLGRVLQRVRRRRLTRRVASGTVALAIGAASLGIAFSAFVASNEVRPAGTPVPGPTPTSDDETPPPLGLSLANGTNVEGLVEYTAARLQYEGVFIREGGYRMVTLVPQGPDQVAEGDGPWEVTTIFSSTPLEGEAIRLRDALFPGAELRPPVPGQAGHDGVPTVIIGEDFARRNAEGIEAFAFVTDFMEGRFRGAGAEDFLTAEAARLYDQRFGGLSLYGYTSQSANPVPFSIVAIYAEGGGYRAIVRISRSGSTRFRHEEVQIDPAETAPSRFLITYAERNE